MNDDIEEIGHDDGEVIVDPVLVGEKSEVEKLVWKRSGSYGLGRHFKTISWEGRNITLYRLIAVDDIVLKEIREEFVYKAVWDFDEMESKFDSETGRHFHIIPKGTIGGWVEDLDWIGQTTNIWVGQEAMVFGKSYLSGHGIVTNSAIVADSRIDLRGDWQYFFLDGNAIIKNGVEIVYEQEEGVLKHDEKGQWKEPKHFVVRDWAVIDGDIRMTDMVEMINNSHITASGSGVIRSSICMSNESSIEAENIETTNGFISMKDFSRVNVNKNLTVEGYKCAVEMSGYSFIESSESISFENERMVRLSLEGDSGIIGDGDVHGYIGLEKDMILRFKGGYATPVNMLYINQKTKDGCPNSYSLQMVLGRTKVPRGSAYIGASQSFFEANLRHKSCIGCGISINGTEDDRTYDMIRFDENGKRNVFSTVRVGELVELLKNDVKTLVSEVSDLGLFDSETDSVVYDGYDKGILKILDPKSEDDYAECAERVVCELKNAVFMKVQAIQMLAKFA